MTSDEIVVTQAQLQRMTFDVGGLLSIKDVIYPNVVTWAIDAQDNILGNGDEPNFRVLDG